MLRRRIFFFLSSAQPSHQRHGRCFCCCCCRRWDTFHFHCRSTVFRGVISSKLCFKRGVKRQKLCLKQVQKGKNCVHHGALICQNYHIPRRRSVKEPLSCFAFFLRESAVFFFGGGRRENQELRPAITPPLPTRKRIQFGGSNI